MSALAAPDNGAGAHKQSVYKLLIAKRNIT